MNNCCSELAWASGDYHEQMNYNNFSKWANEMVINNLTHNIVVVMDNALYHKKKIENKVPSRSATK